MFRLRNDQIIQLEERKQESGQQVRVLENAALRAGDEMRTSSASLAQGDAELVELREALAASQAAHTAATKRSEEIRAELLGTVEEQQQESDRTLCQKEKQIGVLQESLSSLQKESDKSSKQNVRLKTPQKTPKSILEQPGSECKRRRVCLISPERTSEVEDTQEGRKPKGLILIQWEQWIWGCNT
ncbi:unnamed protein product [Rodentolepis nana]|uniref:Myosin_tail_1 domain-containing protein n=1 Tax=Rodentolepis nana TaxID=102285 RepID=A0A0R3T956_RODNA|nr:unnamed protein product [Rodentolepis nana]